MRGKCLVVGESSTPTGQLQRVIDRLKTLGFDVEYQTPGPIAGLEFDYVFIEDILEEEYDHYKTPV